MTEKKEETKEGKEAPKVKENGGLMKTVEVPEGTTVEVSGREVIVKKGENEVRKKFRTEAIQFEKKDNSVVFSCAETSKKYNAIMNTFVSIVKNMIAGVDTGYVYKLKIVQAHFPITAQVKEDAVEVSNFTGEKKPRVAKIVGKTKVEIKGKDVTVTGISKEDAGQTAANIEKCAKVKNRDLRIFQDGIYLVEKGQGEVNEEK